MYIPELKISFVKDLAQSQDVSSFFYTPNFINSFELELSIKLQEKIIFYRITKWKVRFSQWKCINLCRFPKFVEVQNLIKTIKKVTFLMIMGHGLFKIILYSFGYKPFLNRVYLRFFHASMNMRFKIKFVNTSMHKWKLELWVDLKSTNKGNLSITEFLFRVKVITNFLHAVGESILEQDQIDYILDGLSKEYILFVMQVYGSIWLLTLYDVKVILYVQKDQFNKFRQE